VRSHGRKRVRRSELRERSVCGVGCGLVTARLLGIVLLGGVSIVSKAVIPGYGVR
jgi:hypothetical protein